MTFRHAREIIALPAATASPSELSAASVERGRIRAEYFGLHAAAMREVQEFRRKYIVPQRLDPRPADAAESSPMRDPLGFRLGQDDLIGAATVSAPEAENLLSSPAATVLAIEDFEDLGVPLFDHRSELVSRRPLEDGTNESWVVRFEVHEGRTIEREFIYPHEAQWIWREIPPVHAVWQRAFEQARKGSVLYELNELSTILCHRFPWDLPEAAWFVLTGVYPDQSLIETQIQVVSSENPPYTDGRIVIAIDPTLSPEEVADHYAAVRRRLLGTGRHRRAEKRTLEVFRFTTARRIQDPTVSWAELAREWDRTISNEWSFDGDERAFRTYWHRGFRSVFPEMSLARVRGDEEDIG